MSHDPAVGLIVTKRSSNALQVDVKGLPQPNYLT